MATGARAAIAAILAWSLLLAPTQAANTKPRLAPEFTHQKPAQWINSPPLTIKQLRGEVLLLDFWTFDCWNCIRTLPWLQTLIERYQSQPFRLIGVHTPEFQHERRKSRLQDKIKLLGIDHPVMIDNDFSYWNALGVRFWPTFYLVDKSGMIRSVFYGETRSDQPRAAKIEQMIELLLAEPAPG